MDAITGLRYCLFITHHLYQGSVRKRTGDGLVVEGHQLGCEPFECDQFVRTDVVLFILGETVNEDGPYTCPEYNQRPKSARLPLAKPRNPLFDDAAAKIRGD